MHLLRERKNTEEENAFFSRICLGRILCKEKREAVINRRKVICIPADQAETASETDSGMLDFRTLKDSGM